MRALLVLAIMLVLSPARADGFLDGLKLLDYCKGTSFQQGVCLGYIVGHLDTDVTLSGSITGCIPGEVTLDQVQRVVEAYLNKSPEKLHHRADRLVGVALYEAFPCDK